MPAPICPVAEEFSNQYIGFRIKSTPSVYMYIVCNKFTVDYYMLEKYLNIQDCLEKSLKIKFALKSTRKTLKGIDKSLEFYHLQEDSTVFLETKSV